MFRTKNIIKYIYALCLVMCLDGFVYEPYSLKITSYDIKNEQLSGIKVVFATDFHIADYKWEKWRLERIINKINGQNPDLVILGGDYINRHYEKGTMPPQNIVNAIQQIKAPKFAILGNHDSYYGKEKVLSAFEKAKILVLDNKNIKLKLHNKEIYIAGVSDYLTDKPNINKALDKTNRPLIFVTHSPDVFAKSNINADITFAGHTHAGQVVLPFLGALIVNIESGRKYTYGLINKSGKLMIVSSGLGTSIIPVRFYNIPEIVVVNFM